MGRSANSTQREIRMARSATTQLSKRSPKQRIRQVSKIDGMAALESAAAVKSTVLTSLSYILDKSVERANAGMLPALRNMADNYCRGSEAQFIFEVGKAHVVPIGGDFMTAFNEVLAGKPDKAGYRKVCARAYELWIENLPLMRAREKAAKAHLVGDLTPQAQARISGLRLLFDAEVIERRIAYGRLQMLKQPVPGEPGYAFDVHVKALKRAIDSEREHFFGEADAHADGVDADVHRLQCASMFDAAMKLICARNPQIAEAYRENLTPQPSGSHRGKASLQLV